MPASEPAAAPASGLLPRAPGILSAGSSSSRFLPRPPARSRLAVPGQGLWSGLSGGAEAAPAGGSLSAGSRRPAAWTLCRSARGLPHNVAAPGPGRLPGWRGALELHSLTSALLDGMTSLKSPPTARGRTLSPPLDAGGARFQTRGLRPPLENTIDHTG